jgi:nucleoside-diphosphate-sugar epimerase
VDHVVHLAAIANDPSGDLDPELTRAVNYRAYPVILEEARKAGVKRFLNASTFSVYGIKPDLNVTEGMALHPLKEYSICKAKSEKVVRQFNSFDFVTTSIRLATVCGWSRRMRFDLIVNTLTYHGLLKGRIVVLGGNQQRPQIHVQDITDHFAALLTVPPHLIGGEIFNAGGHNVSIMEIAEAVRSVLDKNVEIETAPAREDERSYHVSSDKLEKALGLRSSRTIEDAIADVMDAHYIGLWKDPTEPLYNNVKRMKQLGVG